MLTKIESKKQLLITSTVIISIFYLVTHGYRFFNPMFSGDSLLMIHQTDSAWQIALGRFMQPILVLLRGGIASPFLISAISILWFSLSLYFLVDFLQINRLLSILFTGAVMVCNPTVLAANATYVPYMDFYALALFLSILGVWLIKRGSFTFTAFGIISISISMGIYQSYVCVAIALVMLHFLFQMWTRPTLKETFISVAKYLISFVAAAALYYLLWKLFQRTFHIWTANSYNGLSSIGDYSEITLGSTLFTTYKNVLHYLIHPETFTTMPFRGISLSIFWVYLIRTCNLMIVLLFIFSLIKTSIKCQLNLWQRLVQLLIILLFPLGINFVCLISKGMEHTLMIYAFCLIYVSAIKAGEGSFPESKKIKSPGFPWLLILLSLMILSWSNIVYSNQVYLKKDLQDQATHSLMTRIVYEIESTEEYVPGVTPVAFYGSFENTSALSNVDAFKDLLPYGMGKSTLTYVGTDYAYLTQILNVNMNLTRISGDHEMVKQMPTYPTKGSVAFVDGILVVKISE